MKKSDKRVVIVTGATRGIGAAIAQEFWRQGAHVIITGTNQKEINRLKQNVVERQTHVHTDFLDPQSLDTFRHYINSLKRLDVCVNNAGINIIKNLKQVTSEDFSKVIAVDLWAPYFIAQTAAQVMRRNRCGWIINIGSIWSVITKKGRSTYSSAKAGLSGMTRALATELADDGILVNCVSPGFVLTDLTRQSLSPVEIRALEKQIPLGRFADPDEIARLVAFLGGKQNTYITGQNIVVDGGFSNV